ncbi:MAG: hypothetical protein U0T83_02565 [Bacteriovoracaceae bacterium]
MNSYKLLSIFLLSLLFVSLNLHAQESNQELLIEKIIQNELSGKNSYKLENKAIEFLKASVDTNPKAAQALYLIKENKTYELALKSDLNNFLLKKINLDARTYNEPIAKSLEEIIALTESKNMTSGLKKDWINFLLNRVNKDQFTPSTIESLLEIRRRRTVYPDPTFRKNLWNFLETKTTKSERMAQYLIDISKNKNFHIEVLAEAVKLTNHSALVNEPLTHLSKISAPNAKQAFIERTSSGNYFANILEKKIETVTRGSITNIKKLIDDNFGKLPKVGPEILKAENYLEKINLIEKYYAQPLTTHKPQNYARRLAELVDLHERVSLIDKMAKGLDTSLIYNLEQVLKKVQIGTSPYQAILTKKIESVVDALIMDGAGLSRLPSGEVIFSNTKTLGISKRRIYMEIHNPFMRNSLKRFVKNNFMTNDAFDSLLKTINHRPSLISLDLVKELRNYPNIVHYKRCLQSVAETILKH